MKTKKTIRKMSKTPLARKAAHLTRSVASIAKRLKYLTEAIQQAEMERNAFEAQSQHMLATWIPPKDTRKLSELWLEHPDGEAVGPSGLTESEVLQGRDPPPGCDTTD